MAENKSPNLLLDDLSPEENTLSKVQGKPDEVPFGMIGSSTDEYAFLTPEPKLGSQKHDYYTSETFLGSVSSSSDISTKECSETVSSSSSSSDAESATYEALQPKVVDLDFDTNVMEENVYIVKDEGKEGMLMEKKHVLYEELLEKVANYEIELKFTKKELQSSQEEIAKLKYENLTLVEELGGTIQKLRISEENTGKVEIKLRNEVEKLQNQYQVQLDLANQSIDHLQAELVSERRLVSELQERVNNTTNDSNDYVREVKELKRALCDAQKEFSKYRSQFQNDFTFLNDQKDALELRNIYLEEQITQYEVEKIEAEKSQEARKANLLNEIKQLNKNLDASKLNYDMLMAEKDEVFAKVQKLAAELSFRDTNILQMEERISKLTTEHKEVLVESERTRKLVEELRLNIADQENELEKQRVLVYDRAEEKREAIRQLCFSLEYYRNGYHELCQAFIKHKQPAVLAA